MKTLIILLISFIYLQADAKQDMFKFYKQENYLEACNIGMRNFKQFNNDEEFVSLYGFSCLKSDYIDRLATPITKLKFTKEARLNGSYFSIILMQKKLLYHAMIDNLDLSEFNFPTTDHILSKVFDHYAKTKERKDLYLFEDNDDKNITYKLYLQKGNTLHKIVIEELHNSQVVKKHMYW